MSLFDLPGNLMAIYGISLIALVLGFFALLTQKFYVDAEGKQVTDVEIPLFGKMKTNAPALLFVFGGFALAYVGYDRSIENLDEWSVSGLFRINPQLNRQPLTRDELADLEKGRIFPHPTRMTKVPEIENGEFSFHYTVPQGMTIEDVVDNIGFLDHPRFTGNLVLNPVGGGEIESKSRRARRYIMYVQPRISPPN
jgi:hypothetical protein